MPVLVLGGTGFIGPRVIRRLVERGERVVCMDINPAGATFRGLEDRVTVARGDVTHFEDVMRIVLDTRPERVINLAYQLGGGEGNPRHAVRLNVLGMDNCFEAARLGGVKRVVYASSKVVYGQQSHFGERTVTEEDPRYGAGQYAVCKIFNEYQAEWYIKAYGMSIAGVRPANVMGPDKVRGLVDHVHCIVEPARGQPVRLPFKDVMRLPIHVEDIAEAFVRVSLVDSSRHTIYNSGGHPITVGAMADLVREFLPDARITFDNDGGREQSGAYLVDNSRLLQEFDLEYAPLRQRVLEIINDVRQAEGLPLVQPR